MPSKREPPRSPARRLHRSCKEVIALLTEFMEGDLSATAARDLERHLDICPPCKGFLDNLKTARAATRKLRVKMPDASLASLRARLAPTRPGKPRRRR